MNRIKSFVAIACAMAFLTSASSALAVSCCVKAKAAGKDCEHKCCVDAHKSHKACEKCQAEASCCDKAIAEGKECAHKCCVDATKNKKICEKCNKVDAKKN